MILRIDKMAIDLPQPKNPSPNSASAIQDFSVVALARCPHL